jgi:hypothetical protein
LKIRFCLILPTIYAIIALCFEAACFSTIGHGAGCVNLYRAGIPAVYLFPENLSLFVVWAFAAGLVQYFLLGFLLDKIIALIGKTLARGKKSEPLK